MWTGRSAAALATIPVPITDANQFGPRSRKTSLGRSSASSSLGRRGAPKVGPGAIGTCRGERVDCGRRGFMHGMVDLASALRQSIAAASHSWPECPTLEPHPASRGSRVCLLGERGACPLEPQPERASRALKRRTAATHGPQGTTELHTRHRDGVQRASCNLRLDRAF